MPTVRARRFTIRTALLALALALPSGPAAANGFAFADEAEVERRAVPSIGAFKQKLLRLVDAREWESSLFAQNVMLETMEYVAFGEHARTADARTRDLLERVLRDERRHLGFGENEIARCIQRNPGHVLWVATVKGELGHPGARDVRALGSRARSRSGRGRSSRSRLPAAVERLGIAN